MRILVTGGAGFSGSHLAEKWLRAGHAVTVLNTYSSEAEQNLATVRKEISLVWGSVPDREIVEKLVALRGVGMWTAQWALIRAVGRPDALPLGDLALRRVVSRLFMDGEDVNDAKVEEIAQRWSPYRTYATVYLFSALRTGAG